MTSGLRSLSAQASRRQATQEDGQLGGELVSTTWHVAQVEPGIPIDRSSSRVELQAVVDESGAKVIVDSNKDVSFLWATREISELCSSTSGGRQLPWSMPGPIHRGIARLLSGLMRSRTLAWGERWRTYAQPHGTSRARVTSSLKG